MAFLRHRKNLNMNIIGLSLKKVNGSVVNVVNLPQQTPILLKKTLTSAWQKPKQLKRISYLTTSYVLNAAKFGKMKLTTGTMACAPFVALKLPLK